MWPCLNVDFVAMTKNDYDAWREFTIKDMTADRVKAGNVDPEHALESSAQQFDELLPKGLDTPGQHVCVIVDASNRKRVGVIWYGDRPGSSASLLFLAEFWVDEEFRGKGYGTASLRLLEERARELGKSRIALHVFGHNLIAQRLYQKAGYVATNISMAKSLYTMTTGVKQ